MAVDAELFQATEKRVVASLGRHNDARAGAVCDCPFDYTVVRIAQIPLVHMEGGETIRIISAGEPGPGAAQEQAELGRALGVPKASPMGLPAKM